MRVLVDGNIVINYNRIVYRVSVFFPITLRVKSTFNMTVFMEFLCTRSPIFLLTNLVILVLSTGCAIVNSSYENRYFPVKDHIERESSLGFTITPPSGIGWYEKLNNRSLYYLKKSRSEKYSIFTKAEEIHLKQSPIDIASFVEFVENEKKLNISSGTYKNHSFHLSVSRNLSPYCVKYFQQYDDYSKQGLRGGDFVKVNNGGLVCMHPETPGNGVDMFYVESFLNFSPEHHTSFKQEGEHFLKSLKFQSFGG